MMDEGSGAMPTFFKDVAPVEQARTVDVDLDQQTDDVNIQPAFGRLYRVTGQAVAPPRSGPVTVELMSDMGPVPGSVDSSGRFAFDQLAPGIYEITAAADAPWREKLGVYAKLSVDKDLDGMRFQLTQEPQFYIEFEEKRGRLVDPKTVVVWARRKSLAGEEPARHIRPQEDPLPPGTWEVSATPPLDFYVARITGDRGDLESRAANGWKEFLLPPGGHMRVKVELSSAIAALHGRVLGSGLRRIIAGLAVGLVLALACSEVLDQIVKDTQLALDTRDPITYIVVSLVLISAALAAMLRPAFRAGGSDAAQALRHD
jgi:hypothetical protein